MTHLAPDPLPTFGQLLRVLDGLGFRREARADGVVVCEDIGPNAWFRFRARPLDAVVRPHEVVITRLQLDAWGYLTPAEFDQRIAAAAAPTPAGT